MSKVWKLLLERGPALGLHLNPSKCEWSWLDPERSDPCPIDGVAFVAHSQIQMLGVPLGCDEFVAGFVDKKLLGRLQNTVDKLVDFEVLTSRELQHCARGPLHADNAPPLLEGSGY